jgi:cytochrome b561
MERALYRTIDKTLSEKAMQVASEPMARYTQSARRYHWLTFALVTIAYVLINLREAYPRGSDGRLLSLQGHFLAGLLVLALVMPRILQRHRNAPPPISPPLADWEASLSRLTHGLLYAFLIVQPLLGLLTVFSAGRGIGIPFTGIEIPSPLARNRDLSELLEDTHGWIGTIFYYVIGLHIASALWHHFFRRDNTLRRMG